MISPKGARRVPGDESRGKRGRSIPTNASRRVVSITTRSRRGRFDPDARPRSRLPAPISSSGTHPTQPCARGGLDLPSSPSLARAVPSANHDADPRDFLPLPLPRRDRRQVRHPLRCFPPQGGEEAGGVPALQVFLRLLRQVRHEAPGCRHLEVRRLQEDQGGRGVHPQHLRRGHRALHHPPSPREHREVSVLSSVVSTSAPASRNGTLAFRPRCRLFNKRHLGRLFDQLARGWRGAVRGSEPVRVGGPRMGLVL